MDKKLIDVTEALYNLAQRGIVLSAKNGVLFVHDLEGNEILNAGHGRQSEKYFNFEVVSRDLHKKLTTV